MNDEIEPYAYLRVQDRRFYGSWKKLRRCIKPSLLFRRDPGNFSLPLDEIKLLGRTHSYGAVYFKMNTQLSCVGSAKDVYSFTATLGSNPHPERVTLLILALMRHGECIDCKRWEYEENSLYRL
jgi:hypothetical protein